jgi:general secretion pathway protein I
MTDKAPSGFTLLEIIIALAIVSVSALAIGGAMNTHIQTAAGLEQRVLASWVASDRIALLRHDAKINKIKTGSDSDTIDMGGHRWRAKTNVEKTDVEHVYLVTVTVKDDADRSRPAFATLTTAISDSF